MDTKTFSEWDAGQNGYKKKLVSWNIRSNRQIDLEVETSWKE